MNRKSAFSSIFLSIILTLIVVIFFGGFLSAKLSTVPLFRHFNILNPQAPIVINRTEQVRISDSTDALDTISKVKSQLSTIVQVKDGKAVTIASALNLTSDGAFVTILPTGVTLDSSYSVVLNDGRSAAVTQQVVDPATGIVYVKASVSGVPVVSFGISKNATPGDKLLLLAGSTLQYSPRFLQSFVTSRQQDIEDQLFDADAPQRTFGVQAVSPIPQAAALFNLKGEVVGMWSGATVVSSDVVQRANRLYFNDAQHIIRPHFGFTYRMVTKTQAGLLGLPEGAQIVDIVKGTASEPAVQAGLQPGDVITKVNDQNVNENTALEELIEQYKPLDMLKLTVERGKQEISLTLTAGFKK